FPLGGEARGGGINLFGTGNNSLVNCTIAGNSASATSGQEFFFFGEAIGGGIADADNGPMNLTNCTVVNNSAVFNGQFSEAYGGGMYLLPGGCRAAAWMRLRRTADPPSGPSKPHRQTTRRTFPRLSSPARLPGRRASTTPRRPV